MSSNPKHDSSGRLNPHALWNEISIARSGIDTLLKQSEQTGDLKPVYAALDELQLKTSNYEKLLQELQGPVRAALGRNFLGIEEWINGLGVHVGVTPPIPQSITPEFLNSKCPLYPRQTIKESHVLMLIPKTVNGERYTPLKLDELCATRKGSTDKLIYDGADWATDWKELDWASLPEAQSAWVLLPKSDPDPYSAPHELHFRFKNIAAQQKVQEEHYSEYREARALEVMTMALLYDLTHKERPLPLLPVWLRCAEPDVSGGRVLVGYVLAGGLGVVDDDDDLEPEFIGRALARKL
jgi:hypothetical protein